MRKSTLTELGIVAVLGILSGFTGNIFLILGSGLIIIAIAGLLARKVDVATQSKTSYDQMGSGFAAFFIAAVVYVVFYLFGAGITLL